MASWMPVWRSHDWADLCHEEIWFGWCLRGITLPLSLSLEWKCFVCFTTQMYLSNSMCKIFLQIFPGDSSCKPTCSRTPPFFLVRFDLHSKESALALNFSLFWRTFLKYLLKLKMLESDCHKCTWCGVWIFFLGGQFEIQRDASVFRSVDFIFSAGGCEKSSQLHDCQRLRCTPGQKKYTKWSICHESTATIQQASPTFFIRKVPHQIGQIKKRSWFSR